MSQKLREMPKLKGRSIINKSELFVISLNHKQKTNALKHFHRRLDVLVVFNDVKAIFSFEV